MRPGAAGAEEGVGADEGLLDFAARDAAVVVFWRLGAAWEDLWEGLGRFIVARGIVVRGEKGARSVCTLVACGSARWKFLEAGRRVGESGGEPPRSRKVAVHKRRKNSQVRPNWEVGGLRATTPLEELSQWDYSGSLLGSLKRD